MYISQSNLLIYRERRFVNQYFTTAFFKAEHPLAPTMPTHTIQGALPSLLQNPLEIPSLQCYSVFEWKYRDSCLTTPTQIILVPFFS